MIVTFVDCIPIFTRGLQVLFDCSIMFHVSSHNFSLIGPCQLQYILKWHLGDGLLPSHHFPVAADARYYLRGTIRLLILQKGSEIQYNIFI